MDISHVHRWSLKTKITVLILLIFLFSMWALALMASKITRTEMTEMLGQQQFATTSMQAKDLNSDLIEMKEKLEKISLLISADLMRHPQGIQEIVENRYEALSRFNAGIFITDKEGTAVASMPVSRNRMGMNFIDRDFIAKALAENQSVIGRPMRGKLLPNPLIGMAAPIRDRDGRVIGLVAGVINLGEPNFMDHFTDYPYGKTGGYLILMPEESLIITATNKSRIMTQLPPGSQDELYKRFNQGYEGFGVRRSSQGFEVLASSANIPVTGWRIAATVPSEEVFAPIKSMQLQMFWGTLLLTLLASWVTWWFLRSQLSPLTDATQLLGAIADSSSSLKKLPIVRHDEIGQLITGFNDLLALVETRSNELQQERENLQHIIFGTAAGTWVLNLQDGSSVINERWAEIIGHTAAELSPVSQKTWVEKVHPDDLHKTEQDLARYLSGEGDSFEAVFRMRHKDGHWVWVQTRAKITARDDQGQPLRVSGTNLDVSKEKAFEQSLIVAKEQAELATVAKSQFLSNMSHEIRTPMNAILGLLQLMHSTPLSRQQLDYIVKTEGAAKSLLGLINDILDISKMEAGKLELDPQPFRLDGLLSDLSVILSTGVSEKPIEVLFDIPLDAPKVLVGDALRLKQILINLGSNAIKFTLEGTVVLQIRVVEKNARRTTLRFSMIDSGIGIEPAQQERIFEGFAQAEASTTRRFGGTGLGLSICKQLVALMGGELRVQSQLNQGSNFYFTVTLPNADEGLLPKKSLQNRVLAPMRFLLVDDNQQAREILAAMLESWGWSVDLASSGSAAVQMVRNRIQTGQAQYQVLLVDWYMPEMDGWETLKQLQALFPYGKAPMSIMVTAHDKDMLKQRLKYEQTQLDGYLVKPITASMLYDCIVDAVAMKNNQPIENMDVALPQPLAGMRILLVEDNRINQQVAQELLESQGAVVAVADNGQRGVSAVSSASPQFDVVLMDIQMPLMDGFTATRIIRQELGLVDLPIIAMTANAMSSDRDDCLAAGMNAHVGKPFDLTQLVALLKQHVNPMLVLENASTSETDVGPEELDLIEHDTDFLDADSAITRLGGRTELYGRLLKSFLTEVRSMPDQFDGLIQQAHFDDARRLMHTLKGLAATIGANHLAQVVAAVETKLMGSSDGLNFVHLQSQLRGAVATTCAVVLQVNQRYIAPALTPDQHNPAVTLDAPALIARMAELENLLSSSDMQALDVYAQTRGQFGHMNDADLTSLGQALDQAMEAFDFSKAAEYCQKIMRRLERLKVL